MKLIKFTTIMDNCIILYIDFKTFPLLKNIDIVNSPPEAAHLSQSGVGQKVD